MAGRSGPDLACPVTPRTGVGVRSVIAAETTVPGIVGARLPVPARERRKGHV